MCTKPSIWWDPNGFDIQRVVTSLAIYAAATQEEDATAHVYIFCFDSPGLKILFCTWNKRYQKYALLAMRYIPQDSLVD